MVSFIMFSRACLCFSSSCAPLPNKENISVNAANAPDTIPPDAKAWPMFETASRTSFNPPTTFAARSLPIASNIAPISPAAWLAALDTRPTDPEISLNPFALSKLAKPFLNASKMPSHLFLFFPVPKSLSSASLSLSSSAGLSSMALSCSGLINVIPPLSPLPER